MKYLLIAIFLLTACTTSEDAAPSAALYQNTSDVHISSVNATSGLIAYGDEWGFTITVLNPTDQDEFVTTYVYIDDVYLLSPSKNIPAGSADQWSVGAFINDYQPTQSEPAIKRVRVEVFLPSYGSRVIKYVELMGGVGG